MFMDERVHRIGGAASSTPAKLLPALAGSLLLVLCLAASQAGAQDAAWATLARDDLQGIHDLLRDHHPGPVDLENSRYREWLEAGLEQALRRAATVDSYADYVRALQFYTNGFQDGHIGISLEISPQEVDWPGFVVGPSPAGAVEVVYAQPDARVRVGDTVSECDGRSVDALMQQRVDPYYWNHAIPHERGQHFHRLFHLYARDPLGRLKSCRFSSGEVALAWRRTRSEEFTHLLESVQGAGSRDRAPRLHKVGEVWFVSLPTLAYSSDAAVAQIRALLVELKAKAPRLRKSKVVLDVRHNHGGDSAWGEEIAKVLWGPEWVTRVTSSFDGTVDWRASDSNIKFMTQMLQRNRKAGLTESAAYLERTIAVMEAARAENKPLARVEERPKPVPGPPPANPVAGRVFFLTDNDCASACLDFADLVRRLPHVTHVGLPTSADAIYIDNTYAMLPSGLSGLRYSLKVYRNRVRKNNEWYEPQVPWPGGPMTDEALAWWVASMKTF